MNFNRGSKWCLSLLGTSRNFLKRWVQNHKLSIVVIGSIVILIFVTSSYIPEALRDLAIKWVREWYPLIIVLITIVGSIIVPFYLDRRQAEREKLQRLKERYSLEFEILSVEELRTRILPKPIEDYIKDTERKELEEIKTTIRYKYKPRYILIYGPEGVGKSREADRKTHLYIVGASGSGKSKFLELLIRQDIAKRNGFGIIDPHGDLIEDIKSYLALALPKDELDERVVLIDPTDIEN